MKKLFVSALGFIVFSNAFTQSTDTSFRKEWMAIDSLITRSNLPKTALQQVNALYNKATKQQLPAQVIKALLYRLTFEQNTTEEDINKTIATVDAEIAKAFTPQQQSILQQQPLPFLPAQ